MCLRVRARIQKQTYQYLHLVAILKNFELFQVFFQLQWSRWKLWIDTKKLRIIALARNKNGIIVRQ